MAFDPSSIKLDSFDPDNVIDGAAPAKAEQGDYLRGLKKYVPQMQEMYGAGKALVGKAIDSEGMVQSGIETMQDANRKVKEIGSKPTDEFTNVKDVGGAIDWAQHGLGQVTGNLAESLVAAGAGTLLGGVFGNPITAGVGGVGGLVGKQILKKALKEQGEAIAEDQAKKIIGKEVGQNTAIAGMAGFHGAGETGSRAFQEANYDPNQVDLGQVLPRAAGHAAAEFLGDKILLGGMLGKGAYRAAGEGAYPLVKTVAGNMAIVAGKEIPVELVQTVLERDAAKLELMSPEARDEYINTAAQTMLFGIAGAPAGVRSYMAKPPQQTKPMTQEEAAADLTASNTELAGATSAYDALPSDVPQIGYNGKPDAIIVPNQSGGTTEINRNDGALSAAVVDTGITGQMLDNGTTLVPFASRDAAQTAIDQREDADRLTVVPHPRVSGRFAMVPKDRLTLEAQDQAAMRRQQLEQEDGNAPQLDEAGSQGRGSVAGGSGGNASAISGIGGGSSNTAASSVPGRGTSMAMGAADATEYALALESAQSELAPATAQPVASMPGVQARNAERIAAARIAAEARGTALVDEEAAAANTSPSEAQIAAGNYKKGHIKVGPLDISVENPIGSTRSGKEGKKSWTTTMRAHYGYVKRTVGADGDQVDVFVKEGTPADHSGTVYVIDQFNPKTGRFDEHKGMIGYSSQADAARAYDDHFGDKSGPKRRKAVIGMPAATFSRWAKEGDTTSPISQSGRTADEAQAEIEKSTGKLSPSRQKAAGRDHYAVAQEANDRRPERTTGMPEQAPDNTAVARTIGATDFEEVKDEALPDAKDTDAPGTLTKQGAKSLRMLAKLFGKKIVIFKTDAAADGFYINGNTIYIKSDSSVSQLRVLGHEMMHALRRQAPKVYQQMLDAVSELLTDAELKAFYADYNNGKAMPAEMSAEQRDALVEEWMADLGGNRWGEAEFWSSMFAKLEEQHGTTLAKKIINQLRMSVVKVINSLLRTIRGGTMFAVDRRMADNLEKIREAMAQGFADYAKAVKDGRTVEPAVDGVVKFAKKAAEDRKNRTLDEVRSRIGNDYDLTVADNPRVMIDGKPFTTTNVDVDAHGPGLLIKDADATMRRMMDEAIAESGLPANLAKDLRPPTAAYTDKALKLTNGSRFWYELSATGFAGRFFKLPVLMAERLIDIVAGTSGGQQPTDNLKIAVAAMAQDMQDLPVTTGVRDPSSLTGALSPEALTTHKFGNFSDTMQLLANLRPGVEPLPTVDLQMAAVFGIKHAEVASNPVMYETISRFLIKLRDAQNAMQPGAQPYESWQMQALLWVAERNTSDPDSYDIGMPKIVKMLQDAGIPTPGGAITEKTLMDPRVPEVMSPTTKSVPEAPVMTIETRTQLTKTGRSSTEAFNKIKEIDAPWAKKLTREFESIQRRTMRALGNRQPHPKGLSTKQPSVVSQLMAIIMGRTIASWDAVRVDTNGMGTFEGDASPNLRVPMLLAQRGGSDGKGGTPRFMLDSNQRKQLASLIGKDMKQAAMADSQFVSVPLGKHDTFSIFVKRYDKEDISESLLAEISDSLGRPLNYSQVPNGWLIDVNIGGFDETAQQQAENRDVQRIRSAMQKVEKSSGTKYDWHELPRAYASDYIDKSDYNKHIKELENAITRNTDPGRSRGTGDPQQRLGDLARLRAQVQGLYKQQESAFKQWEQEARDTAAKRGVKLSPARYGQPAANGGVAGQGRPGDRQLGRVDVTGTHYSREQRKHLTGGYFGTGLAGEEGKRLKEAKDTRLHSRLYAYVNEGQGVFPEAGVGAYAHTVKLDNLYDIKADPLGIRQKTRDANDRESLILDAGFDGYYAPGVFGRQGVAILMGGAATRGVTPTDTVAPAVNVETAPKTERRTDLPMGKMTGAEWKKLDPRATDLEDGKMYYRDAVRFSPARAQTDTPEFKRWSNGNRLIDTNESHDMHFASGEPVVVRLLHGTTGDFSVFDNARANPESDMGAGFYFTNDDNDVGANYAGEGPDLTNKISAAAERIASDTDRDYSDPDVIEEAKAQLAVENQGFTMPVFVRFDNPVVIGGTKETVFTYEMIEDENGDYQDEVGTLVDFITTLRDVASQYNDGNVEELINSLLEDGEEISASRIIDLARESEDFSYYSNDEGAIVANEIIRETFEQIGFDGIIDQTVNNKFGGARKRGQSMRGVAPSTKHFIAFEPTQIKSAIGNRGTFDATNPDIRYSPPRWYFSPLEKAFESAPDKVFGQAAQVKLWLAGNKSKLGLKDDEIFWTGINDWLDMQGKQKVSKADVLWYLSNNGVQVEEVVNNDTDAEKAVAKAKALFRKLDAADAKLAQLKRQATDTMYGRSIREEAEQNLPAAQAEAERLDAEYKAANAEAKALVDNQKQTKYGKYVLPGGESYLELLLTFPEKSGPSPNTLAREMFGRGFNDLDPASQNAVRAKLRESDAANYKSSHWEEPNILAHIRMNDRTDADGNKVLFIEEVQSDWGQAGKKQGFRVAPNKKRVSEIMSRMDEIERSIGAQAATKDAEYDALEKELGSVSGRNETGPYPSPFVTDTKAWLGLSIKRIMAYAAANGYDKVAFIDGQQSTDRYWKHELIAPAVDRWNEITKPESVRELGDNIFGREMYSLMSLNHMDAGVLPMVKHDQVRKSIVSRIPVDVVDVLSSNGVKAEELFSNGDVVFDRLPVSYRSRAATAFGAAIGQTSASIRAKLSGIESGGSDFEVLPALRASDLGPRELVGILDPQRLFHGGSGLGSEKTTPASAVAKSALLEKGDGLKGQFGSAELAKLLNAHVELRYGREGLLKHSVEPGPGQGMKAFYDRIVPQVVSDQLKKVGGKMGVVRVGIGSVDKTSDRLGLDTSEIQIKRDAAGNWGVEKNPYFVVGGKRLYWNGNTFVEDEGAARVFGSKEEATASVTASSQTGFTVTPKMSDPLPLFSPRRQTETPEFKALSRLFGSSSMPRGVEPNLYQSFVDGLKTDAKSIADLLESRAFISHGYRGLDVPARRKMLGYVISASHNDEVLRRVIASIPVDMMNLLSEKKLSAETILRNKAMLENVFAVDGKPFVSLGVNVSDAIGTLIREVADAAAKVSSGLADGALENDSAYSAGFGDSVLGGHDNTRSSSGFGDYNIGGKFDPANPDIRRSTSRIIGASTRPYSQDHTDFFKRVGRTIDEPSFLEKLGAMRSDFGKKMATGIVDQFRGLKDLGPGGMQAYMLSRLSKGASGAFDALLHHGKLRLRDNVYDADTSGGFVDRLGIPLNGELEDFMWWVAANRADTLSAQGKENLFSPQDIAAGKSLATGQTTFDYTLPGGATTRNRALIYKDALRIFNEFNKNTLDMAEQSGLIDGASRPYWENQFYVPFYRVSEEDNEFIGSNIKSGLVRQRAFQKLKGGTDKLNSDLLSNTLLNWSHLIDASAKNRAAKASLQAAEQAGVAQKVAPDMASYAQSNGALLPPGTKKTVWYMDNGQKQEYKVTDPFVMTAITGLEYAGMRNPIMDTLSKFKHWLTVGVTASPAFKVRNLIRDSLQAIGASELGYNPVTNVVKGFKASNRASQDYVSALAGGGLIRFGTMLEGSESSRVRQLIKSGVKDSTILNSDGKLQQFYDRTLEPLVSAYNEIGNRGEEINRMALYKQLVAQGRSHAEASLLARDLMDFSMQGSFNTIRFLTQIVPFMNARLQGMYKLGRAAKDDPRKLAIVTGATALFSIALMMASEDDDDWKKREDWDRDNFWWFKIGDTAWRIPKPFEVGAVATVAERSVELMLNDEMNGERYRKILKSLLLNNLSMNPVPQAIKPIVDLYANKDSFTGRPIENMSMQRLDPTERYTASTSLPARAVSASIGGALSPVQVDHIVRGYFSWLGTFVVGGADMLSRAASNEPTRPTMDYLKFATQGIGQEVGSGGSRYITQMYDQANELEQAHATWNHLKREGRIEEAREYMAEHADELKRYKPLAKVKEMESKLNERIRAIERSNIDPDQKKTQIDNVKKMKDQVARRVAPGVD